MKLKSAVKNYSGQGSILYLKSPGPLGTSGVEIKMPSFDLSKKIYVEYGFSTIPKGNSYSIYLVVLDPCPLDKILKGWCRIQIKKDGEIIRDYSSKIGDMINAQWQNFNKFYFSSLPDFDVHITDGDSNWILIFIYENRFLDEPVDAHIEITRGGEK